MRKDLLVLGVGGTLPNLFSLSSLCAPVVDDEMRRRASFSRHQHQDLQHQDEHEVIMDHKNLMNNNHGHTVENDEPLDLDGEEDSNDDESDKDEDTKLKSKDMNGKPPYSYVAMIGKSLENHFIS